jgi:hypothetical protein
VWPAAKGWAVVPAVGSVSVRLGEVLSRAWPQAGLQVAGLALARLLVGGVIGRGLHDIRGKKREKKEEKEKIAKCSCFDFLSRVACRAYRYY